MPRERHSLETEIRELHASAGFLADGQLWIDMLESRNVMSHQYDETRFLAAMPEIVERFLPALETLRQGLEGKRND
ncbi:MAG TPA: nucleotidyltransferase substrate binding protein [Polyangiaceae bacterium]|nr:nucleotidyltransferase substrate binding protein [Polyangiaceae bacterium]